MLISKSALGVSVAVATVIAASLVWQLIENARLRSEATQRASMADVQIVQLKQRLATQKQRAAIAETDVTKLLKDVHSVRNGSRASETSNSEAPIDTQDFVKSVKVRASKLIKREKFADALELYVASYRELEVKRPGSLESQELMSAMKALSKKYPPAISALVNIRGAAVQQWQAHPDRHEYLFEAAILNDKLEQGSRTLSLYDSLPTNDPERPSLAMIAFNSFVAAGRYDDALTGKSFGKMLSVVESASRWGNERPELGADIRRAVRDATVTNIEVLTGAGKADDARMLTEKLLAFDDTAETRAAVQQHVDRAQQSRH